MYIFNNVLLSVARASAPDLISLVTPTFNSLIVPSMTMIISIIGSLIALQSGTKDLLHQYSVFTNTSDNNLIFKSVSRFQIMDLIFDEIGTNGDSCAEEFACEIGKITAENVPPAKFLATKVWSNSTLMDSNSYLDNKEKIFIKSLMDPKICEKINYNCGLLQEMDKAIKRIKHRMLTSFTVTTTTTTPAPIAPRSRFGINLDIEKYLEKLNEILS